MNYRLNVSVTPFDIAEYERQLWSKRVSKSRETAIENGVQVSYITDAETERFREKVQPIYEKYCGEYMDIVNEIRKKTGDGSLSFKK